MSFEPFAPKWDFAANERPGLTKQSRRITQQVITAAAQSKHLYERSGAWRFRPEMEKWPTAA
jgi:hypothetical protein